MPWEYVSQCVSLFSFVCLRQGAILSFFHSNGKTLTAANNTVFITGCCCCCWRRYPLNIFHPSYTVAGEKGMSPYSTATVSPQPVNGREWRRRRQRQQAELWTRIVGRGFTRRRGVGVDKARKELLLLKLSDFILLRLHTLEKEKKEEEDKEDLKEEGVKQKEHVFMTETVYDWWMKVNFLPFTILCRI